MDKTLLGILLLPCGAVELNNMFGEFFFLCVELKLSITLAFPDRVYFA